MHIAIDAHAVGTGLAGNETYAVNLIEALAEIDSENLYTLFVTKPAAIERFTDRWANFAVRRTPPHTPLVRIPLTLSYELRRRPVDLLHVQFTAPPFAPCPVVATIHDLAFEHIPETFNRRSWVQLRLTVRRTVRRAAGLIAPSAFTRDDIVRTYGVPEERITVTPEAAAPRFRFITDEAERARVRDRYKITGDYLLAVGSIQPRKNLVRLIRAYACLCHADTSGKLPALVVVGKQAWLSDETMRAANAANLGDRLRFTGYVPDADLPALYSDALCFVYPSYFEGFGIPPLEAMACGAPVITGDRTSLPEVTGDAGIMVDPFDEEALALALRRVIEDKSLRDLMRARGFAQASRFGWRETARLTLKAYERALKGEWR